MSARNRRNRAARMNVRAGACAIIRTSTAAVAVTTIGPGTDIFDARNPDGRLYVREGSRPQDRKGPRGRIGETWHERNDARPYRTSTGFDAITARLGS